VKPCPGDQRSAQDFTAHLWMATQARKNIKGTKKILQENVLYGLIENMNVTLIELCRPGVALELGRMSQQIENI
jgi:hypothetical protein